MNFMCVCKSNLSIYCLCGHLLVYRLTYGSWEVPMFVIDSGSGEQSVSINLILVSLDTVATFVVIYHWRRLELLFFHILIILTWLESYRSHQLRLSSLLVYNIRLMPSVVNIHSEYCVNFNFIRVHD